MENDPPVEEEEHESSQEPSTTSSVREERELERERLEEKARELEEAIALEKENK